MVYQIQMHIMVIVSDYFYYIINDLKGEVIQFYIGVLFNSDHVSTI